MEIRRAARKAGIPWRDVEVLDSLAALERVFYVETTTGVVVVCLKDTYGAMLLDVRQIFAGSSRIL